MNKAELRPTWDRRTHLRGKREKSTRDRVCTCAYSADTGKGGEGLADGNWVEGPWGGSRERLNTLNSKDTFLKRHARTLAAAEKR